MLKVLHLLAAVQATESLITWHTHDDHEFGISDLATQVFLYSAVIACQNAEPPAEVASLTVDDLDYIKRLMIEESISSLWVGLRKNKNDNSLYWEDGEPITDELKSSDLVKMVGDTEDECFILKYRNNWQERLPEFRDKPCLDKYRYLCKRPAQNTTTQATGINFITSSHLLRNCR